MTTITPTTLKITFANETRRLRVADASKLTFDELVKLIESSFTHASEQPRKKIFYFDDEKDKIVIRNDADLVEAIVVMQEDLGMKNLKFLVEVASDTTSSSVAAAVPILAPELVPVVEDVTKEVEEKEYVPLSARSSTTYAEEKKDETAPANNNKEDGLEALLSLFSLEPFTPFARQWLAILEASADDKALYIVNLLKNPEFSDVVAKVRTSEAGTALFNKIEEHIKNGVPPMLEINEYIESGSMKSLLQPIFDKFPELLTHFPMLNHIMDPSASQIHHGVSCDGCDAYPIIGLRFKCKDCPDFDFCSTCHVENKSHNTEHVFEEVPPARNHHHTATDPGMLPGMLGSMMPGMLPGMLGSVMPGMMMSVMMGGPDSGCFGASPPAPRGCPMFPPMHPMMAGMGMPGLMGMHRRPGMGMRGRCGGRRNWCGTKSPPATADTAEKPPVATPSAPSSVPDAATREILRNEKAIDEAIAASLASFADDCNAQEAAAAATTPAVGDEESKEEREVDVAIDTALDSVSDYGFEAIPTMAEKFESQLKVLHSMGFLDDVRNLELLQEKDGNLRDVVEVYFR